MARHRLYHLAVDLEGSSVTQCDCDIVGNHPARTPYRACFECGALFWTEQELVAAHLEWFKDQQHLDPKYWATETEADHHGENLYSCPNCTHDW